MSVTQYLDNEDRMNYEDILHKERPLKFYDDELEVVVEFSPYYQTTIYLDSKKDEYVLYFGWRGYEMQRRWSKFVKGECGTEIFDETGNFCPIAKDARKVEDYIYADESNDLLEHHLCELSFEQMYAILSQKRGQCTFNDTPRPIVLFDDAIDKARNWYELKAWVAENPNPHQNTVPELAKQEGRGRDAKIEIRNKNFHRDVLREAEEKLKQQPDITFGDVHEILRQQLGECALHISHLSKPHKRK